MCHDVVPCSYSLLTLLLRCCLCMTLSLFLAAALLKVIAVFAFEQKWSLTDWCDIPDTKRCCRVFGLRVTVIMLLDAHSDGDNWAQLLVFCNLWDLNRSDFSWINIIIVFFLKPPYA